MSFRRFRLRYVLLLLHYLAVFACSELEILMDFPERRVVQSGTGNFTALTNSGIQVIEVKCTVKHFEGSDFQYNLTLRTEGLNQHLVSNQHSLVQRVQLVNDHMVFSCHLSVIYPKANLFLEKRATLKVINEQNFPQCISSIGTLGLPNEHIQLVCVNCKMDTMAQLTWKNEDVHSEMPIQFINGCQFVRGTTVLEVEDMIPSEMYSCGYANWGTPVCSIQVDIKQQILLKIDPPIFNTNDEHLMFTCFSDPPSELRWNIQTELGDLLSIISQREVKSPNLDKQTQTKINITYTHGKSTLNLTTTTRVHLVSCWTFREVFRQVVSTAVPYETVENCTSMVTDQSTLPEDTVECLSQCVPGNTTTSQSLQKCSSERIVYFIIIGGLFVLVLILAAYLITRLLMKSFTRSASDNTTENDNLPPMVANTAYVEYDDANKN